MPRAPRLDAPGTLHHVILRGIERHKIVKDNQDRENFVARMGAVGLPTFMRRFLSGYATSYNRRHHRYVHVFQNRYKSIICEEDAYFKELVQYIHLNPIRAKMVKGMTQLDRYRWCGHGVVMGHCENEWQDVKYILKWFGRKKRTQGDPIRRLLKRELTWESVRN